LINRHLNQNIASVINILFIYYIEAAHVTVIVICWSFMYVDTIGPMPFYLGQMVLMIGWSAADIMLILGSIISLVKIIYVINFDLIFNQNQESTSRILLGASLLAGCAPHLIIYIDLTAREKIVSSPVTYFTGEKVLLEGVGAFLMCGSGWLFLSGVMLVFAVLFIRNYEHRHQHLSTETGETCRSAGMTVSLPGVLLGVTVVTVAIVIGIMIQVYRLDIQFPLMMLIYAVFLIGMLTYFTVNENIVQFLLSRCFANLTRKAIVLRTSLGNANMNRVHPV
jgi:hypothetical protein